MGHAEISEELIGPATRARTTCDELFLDSTVQSADLVLETLATKHITSVHSIDRCFDVDETIIRATVGASGDKRLIQAVMDVMPTATQHLEPSSSLQRLNGITTQPVFKYGSRALQGKLGSLQTAIGRIVDERVPDVNDLLVDTDMKGIMSRFQFWCRVEIQDGLETKTVHGAIAIRFIYDVLKAANDADPNSRKNLAKLKTFIHLVPDDLVGDAKKLINALDGPQSTKPIADIKKRKRTDGGQTGGAAASSSSSAADQTADSAVRMAYAIFD